MNRKILNEGGACSKHSISCDTDWITLASVISAIAVVLLHTNGCFWIFSATESYWLSANIIESVFYFAVPVFFMISASTLLDFNKRYGLGTYFKKRINKTVIPYVFWSLFGIWTGLSAFLASDTKLLYILKGLAEGSLVGVYWFFIPLFSIYLSIPLFAAVPEANRKTLFTYISVASFVLCVAVPFIVDVFEMPVDIEFTIGVGAGYLFYVPTGYLISRYEIKPWIRKVIYAVGIIGLIVHIVGTYAVSMAAGEVLKTFKGYCNLPSVVYSVAIFVFFRYHGNQVMRRELIGRAVRFLGKYTFSIYLLHYLLLTLVQHFLPVNIYSLAYRLLMPIPLIAVSVIGTYVARKIPVVRRLLP